MLQFQKQFLQEPTICCVKIVKSSGRSLWPIGQPVMFFEYRFTEYVQNCAVSESSFLH